MVWLETLDAYLAALAAEGRRPHTLRGYRGDLRGLAEHLEDGPVDAATLRGWRASLEGFATATQARRVSAARGFLRWASAHGVLVPDVAELKPSNARPSVVARGSSEPWLAVEASLGAIPLQADLDQLLFKLLARAGLRPGEALALQIEDFDPAADRLHVVGWGGVAREVWIDDPELRLRLTHWIRATGRTSGPLFCAANRTTPLRYQSMLARWQRYADASGTRLRLGDLRSAHAAQLLDGGVPEWVVRERLGQPTGPLPMPAPTRADDEIHAWRERVTAPPPATRRRRGADAHRATG
jgi:integrase